MNKTAHVLDLASILGVPGSKTIKYLKVPLGAVVKEGDILAERKTPLKKTQVKAPDDGLVSTLNDKGELKLLSDQAEEPAKAEEPKPESPITASAIQEELSGEAFCLEDGIKVYDIPAEVSGKIAIYSGEPQSALAYKLGALEAQGLVFLTTTNKELDLKEELSLPVFVLDAVKYPYSKVKKWHQKKIKISQNQVKVI